MTSLVTFQFVIAGCMIYFLENTMAINRALYRPTYQGSAHNGVGGCGSLVASKAVDGNHDSNIVDCYCFHASIAYGAPQWMAVDLGTEFKIDYIVVYGRIGSENRLDKFFSGLTKIFPSTSTVQLYSYPLCGQYPGPFQNSRVALMKCSYNLPPGRYSIIQMNPTSAEGVGMAVCELEVYELPVRNWLGTAWKTNSGAKLEHYGYLIINSSRGITSCLIQCLISKCDSINFYVKNGTCEFNSHIYGFNESQLMNKSDWNFWKATND